MPNDLASWTYVVGGAALPALTFIAYRHPSAYKKIFPITQVAMFIVMASLLGYSFGLTRAMNVVSKVLDPDHQLKASNAISDAELQPWWIIIYIGIAAYSIILLSFPLWLLDEKENKPDSRK